MSNQLLSQSSTHAAVGSSELDPRLAELSGQLAATGATLLRNNSALPLVPERPVAVFGRVQLDWISVGYGSGGDVNAPYTTNLLDSLIELNVPVDAELAPTYREWCAANPVVAGEDWGKWPLSFAEMPIDEATIKEAAKRSATAIVVVGRAAGEDRESVLEPGSYYLTEDEERLLSRVSEVFSQTIAIVVTGNVMDLSWAERLGVDALLLAWCGGQEGGRAVARILTGELEPGGRLTDTIAYRYEDYPSSNYFGDPDANAYVEDIYVGYRYFETFAPEKVQYPFGFGLGYSTHAFTDVTMSIDEATASPSNDVTEMIAEDAADTISEAALGTRTSSTALTANTPASSLRFDGTITNVGQARSSGVAQLYVSKPGRLNGTPQRELVGFWRSPSLEPGDSEQFSISVPMRNLAVYDDAPGRETSSSWVLEAGDYGFYLGDNVRSAKLIATHSVTTQEIVEVLEQAAAPSVAFDRFVRTPGQSQRRLEPVPLNEIDLKECIIARMPEAFNPRSENVTTSAGEAVTASGPSEPAASSFNDVLTGKMSVEEFVGSLSDRDVADLTYGDITMDSPLGASGNAGALGGVTEALRAKGIPPAITTDGPSGLRLNATATLLPCGTALASTWDPASVIEMATLHAREMEKLGSDILLGPGMNIHRDPLCGRNFEYFSEDPLLSGRLGAAIVEGVQAGGRSACPKHFAANNQETNRIYNDSRVSERALREIYLRGFEIVVKSADPHFIMTSYNKVNGVWAHYNFDLVETILRREWHYRGAVMTDWWMRMAPDPNFAGVYDSAYRVRGGIDVLMPGGDVHQSTAKEDAVFECLQSGALTRGEVERCAVHVLRYLMRRIETLSARA